MSIEGHFFTIYFPGFVCFVLNLAKISGERLQDHLSSGFHKCTYLVKCQSSTQLFRSAGLSVFLLKAL